MIVIVKRDDIREIYRQCQVEELELAHVELAPELVEQAELIVFVEGTEVRFLKHLPAMRSENSLDVLMTYIRSKAPTQAVPFSVKDFPNHFRHRNRKSK